LVALVGAVAILAGCASARTAPYLVREEGAPFAADAVWRSIMDDARWAANAHNVQSIRLTVRPDGSVVGGLDPARLLPETDPIGRQLVLSLGAFTEAARRSALVHGYRLHTDWIAPDAWSIDSGVVDDLFRWRLEPHEVAPRAVLDGLTAATVKYGLEPAELSGEVSRRIRAHSSPDARFITETGTERVAETIDLAVTAFEIEMRYEPTLLESYHYTRLGRAERRDTPWGLSLVSNFRRRSIWIVDPVTRIFRQSPEQFGETGISLFTETVADGNSLIVMTTPDNSPARWFSSGMALQAAWMDARAAGLELLPLSQGLQEYPQVAAEYRAFHDLWAQPGETVQMILFVGSPRGSYRLSPRLPAEAFFARL
jgi:hypothetical protein